jgi:hypothetical protein
MAEGAGGTEGDRGFLGLRGVAQGFSDLLWCVVRVVLVGRRRMALAWERGRCILCHHRDEE